MAGLSDPGPLLANGEPAALIAVVRAHLRQTRRVTHLETAAWGVVPGEALLAALALLFGPPSPLLALAIPAAAGAAALLLAARRRPGDLECARWADRHLEGESAFSTALGLTAVERTSPAANTLRRFIAARAPACRTALARGERVRPKPLPLAAAAGATLLGVIVLVLARSVDLDRASAPQLIERGESGAVSGATAPTAAPPQAVQARSMTRAPDRSKRGASPVAAESRRAATAAAAAGGSAAAGVSTGAAGGAGAGLGAGAGAGLEHAADELASAIHLQATMRTLRATHDAGDAAGGTFAAAAEPNEAATAALPRAAAASAPAAAGVGADGPLASEFLRRYLANARHER